MARPILASVVGAVLLSAMTPMQARAQEVPLPRIINGQPTDDFEAVGIVGNTLWGGFGTGTLISPTHVLTAAHVAEVIRGAANGIFEIDGQVYQTIAIHIRSDYNSRTLANDIAILELAEPVAGITPAMVFTGIPQVGDQLIIVGYGANGNASGEDGTFGTKLEGITTIDDVTTTQIIWEFDNSDEANTAPGDSGGPGFLEVEGELFIASITSSGTQPDAGLGDIATNTRVDAFVDWITMIVASATQDNDECPADNGMFGEHGNRPGAFRPGGFRPGGFRPSHRPSFGSRPGTLRPGHRRPGLRPGHGVRPSASGRPDHLASVSGIVGTRSAKHVSTPQFHRSAPQSSRATPRSRRVTIQSRRIEARRATRTRSVSERSDIR